MNRYNILMEKHLLKFHATEKKKLSAALSGVLKTGLIEKGNGVFFNLFFSKHVEDVLMKHNYVDLSGFEYTTNKFHIEDYCEAHDVFDSALAFIDGFADLWKEYFPQKICLAYISFQEAPEFGDIAAFSFHVEREGEVVIDPEKLNEFPQPLLLTRIQPSARCSEPVRG